MTPMQLTAADIRRTYGQRIAAAREALGYNRRQVADGLRAAGIVVSPQAVEQWEKGHTAPRDGIRLTLAAVLDVDAAELYSLDGIEQVA